MPRNIPLPKFNFIDGDMGHLVIALNVGQEFYIGNNIRIKSVRMNAANQMVLHITAPKKIIIVRGNLIDKKGGEDHD